MLTGFRLESVVIIPQLLALWIIKRKRKFLWLLDALSGCSDKCPGKYLVYNIMAQCQEPLTEEKP